MIYVLCGENNYEINSFIDKVIKEKEIANINKYDNYNDTLLEDLSYEDMFGLNKAIILNNPSFLTGDSVDTTGLENCLNSISDKMYLFIVLDDNKLDERKKIVKLLKKISIINIFDKLDSHNMPDYIRKYLNNSGYSIEYKAIYEIVSNVNVNTNNLVNELDKLCLYKQDDKNITTKDVLEVLSINIENDIYKLVNAVIKNDRTKCFSIYKNLIDSKEDPSFIVTILAGQFRLYYQTKILLQENMTPKQISEYLKVHPYRVTLAIKEVNNFSEKKILYILNKLCETDKTIKTNYDEKYSALEKLFMSL